MSLTAQQKFIASKIKIALDAVEESYPTDSNVATLHSWLGKGLETFEADFTPTEYSNLGGGTPKDV